MLDRLPYETPWSAGNLGVMAAEAAYAEGGEWLDALRGALADNVPVLHGQTTICFGALEALATGLNQLSRATTSILPSGNCRCCCNFCWHSRLASGSFRSTSVASTTRAGGDNKTKILS